MKKCVMCNTDVEEQATACPKCGSEELTEYFGATTVLTQEAQQEYYAQFENQQPEVQQEAEIVTRSEIQQNTQIEYQVQEVVENQQVYTQQPTGQQNYAQQPMYQSPAVKLSTNRGLLKTILLSLVTFGIYGIVAYSKVSTDINTIASKYDGKKTMHYCLMMFVFSWLTFFIYPIVWMHKISERIGDELIRRNIDYKFNASTFWVYSFLLSFTLIGPLLYASKLFKAMNKLSESYNIYG